MKNLNELKIGDTVNLKNYYSLRLTNIIKNDYVFDIKQHDITVNKVKFDQTSWSKYIVSEISN